MKCRFKNNFNQKSKLNSIHRQYIIYKQMNIIDTYFKKFFPEKYEKRKNFMFDQAKELKIKAISSPDQLTVSEIRLLIKALNYKNMLPPQTAQQQKQYKRLIRSGMIWIVPSLLVGYAPNFFVRQINKMKGYSKHLLMLSLSTFIYGIQLYEPYRSYRQTGRQIIKQSVESIRLI